MECIFFRVHRSLNGSATPLNTTPASPTPTIFTSRFRKHGASTSMATSPTNGTCSSTTTGTSGATRITSTIKKPSVSSFTSFAFTSSTTFFTSRFFVRSQPITPTTSTIPASSPTISSFGSEETPHYNVERESRKLAALIQEGELVLFLERLGPALTRLEPNDRRALLAAGRARAKKAAERAYRRLASFPSHQQVPLGSPLTDDRKPPKPRTPRTPVRTPRSEARSRDPRTPLRGLRNSNNKNDNGIVKAKRGRNNGNIPLFSIGSSSGSPRK